MLDCMRLCKQSTTWYRQASFSSYCLYVIWTEHLWFWRGIQNLSNNQYIAKMGNRWKPLTIFANRVLDKPLNFRVPTFFLTSNVRRFLGILGEVLSKVEKNLVNYRLNHKCFKIFLKKNQGGFYKKLLFKHNWMHLLHLYGISGSLYRALFFLSHIINKMQI